MLLHPDDNVLVCIAKVSASDLVLIDDEAVRLSSDVDIGHKVARWALSVGDKALRYGLCIGTITSPVSRGEHVHRHNLASDYLPAHGRNDSQSKEASNEE